MATQPTSIQKPPLVLGSFQATKNTEQDKPTGSSTGKPPLVLSSFKSATEPIKPKSTAEKAAGVFPQTEKSLIKLKEDPLNLKAKPLHVFKDAWNSYKEGIKTAAGDVTDYAKILFSKDASVAEKIAADLHATAGVAGAVFAPITALFTAAEDIPLIGTAARLITFPFIAIGEAAPEMTDKAIDALPIPKETKEALKPAMGEIASLVVDIGLGEFSFSKAKPRLIKKFGPVDAETIMKQADNIAQEKMKRGIDLGPPPKPKEGIAKPKEEIMPEQKTKGFTPEERKDLQQRGFTEDMIKRLESSKLKEDEVYDYSKKEEVKTPEKKTTLESIPDGKNTRDFYDKKLKEAGFSDDQVKNILDNTFANKKGEIDAADIKESAKEFAAQEKKVEGPAETVAAEGDSGGEKGKSKVGQSVVADAIEKGFIDKNIDTAEYDIKRVKSQAKLSAEILEGNIDLARKIVKGDMPLPKEIDPGFFFGAVETFAKKTGDWQLNKDLANSPLATSTSKSAQTMRLLQEREPDSAVGAIQDVVKARKEVAEKTGKSAEVKVKKTDLTDFIKKLEC